MLWYGMGNGQDLGRGILEELMRTCGVLEGWRGVGLGDGELCCLFGIEMGCCMVRAVLGNTRAQGGCGDGDGCMPNVDGGVRW